MYLNIFEFCFMLNAQKWSLFWKDKLLLYLHCAACCSALLFYTILKRAPVENFYFWEWWVEVEINLLLFVSSKLWCKIYFDIFIIPASVKIFDVWAKIYFLSWLFVHLGCSKLADMTLWYDISSSTQLTFTVNAGNIPVLKWETDKLVLI